MKHDPLFEGFKEKIADIIALTSMMESSCFAITEEERNAVSEVDRQYLTSVGELQEAENAVRAQYRSVCDSCSKEGLIKPLDQRPSPTEFSWREAVRQQEKTALQIREWFSAKVQSAVAEKQRKLQEESEIRAARAAEQEEALRRQADEKKRAEERRAKDLIEAMKRKHKNRK